MVLNGQLKGEKKPVIVLILILDLLIEILSEFHINSPNSFWHIVCHVLLVVLELDQKLRKNANELLQRKAIVLVLKSHLHAYQQVLTNKLPNVRVLFNQLHDLFHSLFVNIALLFCLVQFLLIFNE